MLLSEERISYLLRSYTSGTATEAEENELYEWAAEVSDDTEFRNHIAQLILQHKEGEFEEIDWERIYEQIRKKKHIQGNSHLLVTRQWFRAAAIFLILSLGTVSVYWLSTKKKQIPPIVEIKRACHQNDVKPGGTKAILQAADSSVVLSGNDTSFILAGNQVQIKKGDLRITKAKVVTYTLIVPLGGTYQLVLADGTKVWLNADSRLVYPSVFTDRTREVALTGEAYFEVKKDAIHPFIVKLPSSPSENSRREIKVLGTAFNIEAYPEDRNVITTLVNGTVEVNSKSRQLILHPGQQALLDETGKLNLKPHADVAQVVAWKNGYFQFDNDDIHTIMKQLARWYNIKVNYSRCFPSHRFGAIISRNNKISEILNMLQATGEVRFKIEDQKITVMPGGK